MFEPISTSPKILKEFGPMSTIHTVKKQEELQPSSSMVSNNLKELNKMSLIQLFLISTSFSEEEALKPQDSMVNSTKSSTSWDLIHSSTLLINSSLTWTLSESHPESTGIRSSHTQSSTKLLTADPEEPPRTSDWSLEVTNHSLPNTLFLAGSDGKEATAQIIT